MIIFGGMGEYPHQRDKTVHVCPCGEYFEQLRGTNMLACAECGEVRWLV